MIGLLPSAIVFRPALPIWLIVLLIVTVGVASWYTYKRCALQPRQRHGLWLLRMSAIVLLGWLLLQPERRTVTSEEELPVLAVAVDVSASMAEKIEGAGPTRAARAVEFLGHRRIKSRMERYRVVQFELGAEARESNVQHGDLVFNAPRSYIGSGINSVFQQLKGKDTVALVLLTDGLDHSGETLAPNVRRVPILIPELEKPIQKAEQTGTDYWVEDVSYPKMTVVNWKANVSAVLRRNDQAAAAFPVHLYREGSLLRTSVVQFAENEFFQQVTFAIEPPEVGRILYKVEAEPPADSVSGNNSREFVIDVTDPENRVLYLEGTPRWEFKFLKKALLAERNFHLAAYVHAGELGFINFSENGAGAGGGLPDLTEKELRRFKVIILGDVTQSALKFQDWKQLRDFVDKGGGILLMGGANALGESGWATAETFREVLPAVSEPGARMQEGRFGVALTAAGRSHPAVQHFAEEASLPPLLSFWGPTTVSEFSSVLVEAADGSPIVVTRRFGQGRIGMVLSDSMWRWQLGSGTEVSGKNLYAAFMTQLAFWLSPSKKDVDEDAVLQVLTAKSEVEVRERVVIGAFLGDATTADAGNAPSCTVTTPDARRLALQMAPASLGENVGLGRTVQGYTCVLTPHEPGKYEVVVTSADGTQQADLLLLAKEAEQEKTGELINRDYLQRLADQTGGGFFPWSKRHEVLENISHTARKIEIATEYPIWNRSIWLILLILIFCVEWWWRRRLDLV